ncbi:MAG: group I intron-associated PD-(D/E)XK endonuclease [Candidatus Bathyarchaeia archaeon]
MNCLRKKIKSADLSITMHNLVKGKIAESIAISKLLEQGFEVFSSIADIQGTDLIVAPPNLSQRLLRIQVKSISSSDKAFRIQTNHKTVDYYLLINTENDDIWIIPDSEIVKKLQKITKHPKIKDLMLPVFHKEWSEYKGFNHILKHSDLSFKFHSGRTGKVGEKLAVVYFLRNGFDVYESVADRKGVDLLVSKDDNSSKYR